MNYNQMLLSGLFLSTNEIERACAVAREAGALGAKLTGAGGGGAVIALCDGSPAPVETALREAGFTAFSTEIAASSVLGGRP
jgi:mevalonate kinase